MDPNIFNLEYDQTKVQSSTTHFYFTKKHKPGFDVPPSQLKGSSGTMALKPTIMESPHNCVP